MNFTYDKACRYEFQAKTNFLKDCLNPALVSEMSATIFYGKRLSRMHIRVYLCYGNK